MYPTDAALLDRWRARNDADAFAELLSRHATMVYGACLRVLKNPSVAEEVAQECFVELMKGPRNVRCVGGWLHTVATRRALDRAKAEGRRVEREAKYAATLDTGEAPAWDDTRAFVDRAVAELPEDFRAPIVLRFLEGRSHQDIAGELAVSRSTVRARIDKGIGLVRESLAKYGVVTSVAALSAMLDHIPVDAAPPALVSELGKRALGTKAGAGASATIASTKLALAGTALVGIGLVAYWATTSGDPQGRVVAAGGGAPVEVAPEPAPPEPAPEADPTPAVETPTEDDGDASSGEETVPPEEEEKAAGWRLDLTPSDEMREAMRKVIRIKFEDIHIQDIMEFIQDSQGINMVLDQRVVAPKPSRGARADSDSGRDYYTDGHINQSGLQEKPVEEVLAMLTTKLNLTYKLRGNSVWVSSSRQITQDLTRPLPSAPFSEGRILDKLSSAVALEFEDIHISKILGFVQESFGIKLVLDDGVVMPEVKRGEEPSANAASYATDGMIQYINQKKVPLGEALFVMTRLLDLTYRVDKDGVYISTLDRVKQDF